MTPAPIEEAFRSDLPAEPHQEAHGRAGKLFLSNFHQVESPVFNAKRVSCRWHSCAAEYRGRGAPKKVAFTSDLIPPTWKKIIKALATAVPRVTAPSGGGGCARAYNDVNVLYEASSNLFA